MPFQIEIGGKANAQLADLDAAIGASVERKIQWLGENAAVMVHRRLVGMPEDLAGLCKLRVGDYRVLYWNFPLRNWFASTASNTVLRSIGVFSAISYNLLTHFSSFSREDTVVVSPTFTLIKIATMREFVQKCSSRDRREPPRNPLAKPLLNS